MANLLIDGLDDPVLTDACPSFIGGQSSFGPPDQLDAKQAAELVNIDISDTTATTRRGAESLGVIEALPVNALFWYDTPSLEWLIGIANGTAYKYTGSGWASYTTYSTGSATTPVCMAQLIEKLYFAASGKNVFEWDGASLVDLGSTTGTPGDPPTGGTIMISAYGAMWLTGIAAAPDTLWVSYFLDATQWHSGYGNIRIGQGEGDPITGLCEIDDYQLIVFKRNSIYVLKVNPSALTFADAAHGLGTATITKISDTIGCVSHRSIARVGKDVFFLSDGGVYSVGRILAQKDRELDNVPVSIPIQDVIDEINREAVDTAAAYFWDNRYFLSVPLGDDTTPSTVLVWNTLRQAWSGTWTGWDASCWALSKESGNERLNFGRSDGAVWRWLDYVPTDNVVDSTFQDAGADFISSVKTRAMIMNDPTAPKSPLSLQVEFFNSEATAQVAVLLDEQAPTVLQSSVQTSVGELLLPFTLPAILPSRGLRRRAFGMQHLSEFRSLQTSVVASAGKLSLRAAILLGFPRTTTLEQ